MSSTRRLLFTTNLLGYSIPVYVNSELTDAWGTFDNHDYSIDISSAACGVQLKDTLIHEFIEGINELCNLELNHTQIQTLAAALAQALESLLEIPPEPVFY
jgi:hypothetical protein